MEKRWKKEKSMRVEKEKKVEEDRGGVGEEKDNKMQQCSGSGMIQYQLSSCDEPTL